MFVYFILYDLSNVAVGPLSLQKLFSSFYKCLNLRPFHSTNVAKSVWRLGRKRVYRTSSVNVVTPSDSPKSIRNRCVIEHVGVVFVLLSRSLRLFCR